MIDNTPLRDVYLQLTDNELTSVQNAAVYTVAALRKALRENPPEHEAQQALAQIECLRMFIMKVAHSLSGVPEGKPS